MINKNNKFILKSLLSALFRRRSRILTALLGISIGALVLLGMITLCYGVPEQMGKVFRSYGANVLLLPKGNNKNIELNEVKQLITRLPQSNLIGVTPFRYHLARSNMQSYPLVGTDFSQVTKTSPYWLVDGTLPANANEIMIGEDIAHTMRLKIGDTLPIAGTNDHADNFDEDMLITAIVKSGKSEDNSIFIDLNQLLLLLNDTTVDLVEVSINAQQSTLEQYIAQLKQDNNTIEPHLIKWVTQSETAVLGKLTALLYLVTTIVLLLTMICVATTMMTVVLERRKEIGLKKALGASAKQIATEFLIESAILGFVGGLIGAIGGLIFAQLISQVVFAQSITLQFYFVPLTVVVSMVITIIAGLFPVRKAVSLQPALVLRGE